MIRYTKNILFIFILGHLTVCSWAFLVGVIERNYAYNWYNNQNLMDKHYYEIYLRNWYAIANMVSSVGSGDIYGVTDLERMFLAFTFTSADIFFALAFGLLAEITTNVRENNESENFLTSMI